MRPVRSFRFSFFDSQISTLVLFSQVITGHHKHLSTPSSAKVSLISLLQVFQDNTHFRLAGPHKHTNQDAQVAELCISSKGLVTGSQERLAPVTSFVVVLSRPQVLATIVIPYPEHSELVPFD